MAGLAVPLVVLAGCSGNTTPPTSVTQTSADLHASVSCSSGENCSMYFKYGLAKNGVTGLNTQTATYGPAAGPYSNTPTTVPVSGLQPNTTYGYQACGNAQPGGQFYCVGPDGLSNTMQEFTTLPNCTTRLNPGDDVAAAVQSAAAGATVCLNAGDPYGGAVTIGASNGTSSSPVTLTSTDPANPATLSGRFVTNGTAKWLNVNHLRFVWSSATADTVALTGDHITFARNDVSGSNDTICIVTTDWNGVEATNIKLDFNKIHDCGNKDDPTQPIGDGDRGHAQGVYTSWTVPDPDHPELPRTRNLTVSNNWCYRVAARCFQERSGVNDVWTHNVADYDNWGYHFGDQYPSGNSMTWNISGTHEYSYASSGFYAGGDFSVFGGGTNETFSNNCWQAVTNGPLGNVTMSGNVNQSPQFNDPANDDFRLKFNTTGCTTNNSTYYGLPLGATPGP
jgi:hypothetical protein